jgi:tRNA threonylcarbamoyladenosine biosynthesis protein TsaB
MNPAEGSAGPARLGPFHPLLAIETSSRRGSLALVPSRSGPLLEELLEADAAHARDLFVKLDRLLGRARLGPAQLSAVAVATGPGSFTGLRVGVCAARTLAQALGIPLLGLPSFAVLAWSQAAPGEYLWIATDARAGELYAASYGRTESGLQVRAAPHVLPASVALEEWTRRRALGERALVDAGAARSLNLAPGSAADELVPRAADLARLAERELALAGPHDPASVEPLYLREFGRPAGTSKGAPAGR